MLATAALVMAWWITRLLGPGSRTSQASYDLRAYFYPLYEGFYGRLAKGSLPLWNPYQLCGLPWLATLQGGFFYPPHALYLVLPTRIALAASGLAHLLLVALSTALFASRVGLTPAAATLAAVLFTLRGSIPYWLLWPYMLEAISWLPLGCLAVLGLARGEGRRAVGFLALAVGASLLAGSPQATVFLVYTWTALLLSLLLGAAPARWAAAWGRFGGALALGAVAGSVQLLPAIEMARVGSRPIHGLAPDTMYPLGNPGLSLLKSAITGAHTSFGVLGLSLAPAALLGTRSRPLTLWATAVGVLGLAFALGPVTPLFQIYLALPFLSWFRGPYRLLVLSDFCLAVLAALGLDIVAGATAVDAPRPQGHPRIPPAAGLRRRSALVVGLPIACALALGGHATLHRAPLPALVATGAAVTLLLRAWARARPGAPLVAGALLALATLEVFLPPSRPERLPYDAAATASHETYRETYTTLARTLGSDRVWLLSAEMLPALASKLASRYRVRSVEDYEPMNLRRQAEYFTYAMQGSISPPFTMRRASRIYEGRLVIPVEPSGRSSFAARRRLLDLAAVRLIAVDDGMLVRPEVRAFIADAALEPRPSPGPGVALFETPYSVPRAFVVYRTRPAPPSEELLDRTSDPGFDPLVESYVEGDPGFLPAEDAPARGEAAHFVRDEERVVELDATLVTAGLLVLADSFHPGWQATVDGAPAPILATNHLFRGVPVPAGRHHVRFEYRPWSTVAGGVASLAGILLTVFLLIGHPSRDDPGSAPFEA